MKLKHDHNDKYLEEHCADCIIQKAMAILGTKNRDRQIKRDPDYYRKIQAIGVAKRNARKEGYVQKTDSKLVS